MSDYYQKNYKAYHEKTFSIDPSSFLAPLAQRLPAEVFIMDVGCGSGRDLLWMKKRGFEVIGFERSPGLGELARENVGCEVIEGDFETYDFSAILVDAVMLIGALVHVPHERFSEVFKNITSAIPKNGSVLITLKEGSGDRTDADGRIFYLWEAPKARELFDTLGFKVCDFSTSVSKTGSDDFWLSYVLDKSG
ncbi:MAG: class I SAM-dependent methyltransferase [Deltaproteobacteria bacterium]|nr:class I SAM-dependent methyltransferase [Deltaproteobacteria bacterium]MBW2228291.1 class I SAM-dependent methyltransferase [Deltaproteobacteria bacterium]